MTEAFGTSSAAYVMPLEKGPLLSAGKSFALSGFIFKSYKKLLDTMLDMF